MKRALFAPLAVAAIAWLAGGCKSKPVGQLMLAIQTDLSLPKDIDTIRIEISTAGVPKFKNDFTKLGTADGQIHIPGTLGLIAPEKPDDAVRVIVSARSGGELGKVRIVRDIVTTVPAERVVTLPVPIHFLCDGQGTETDGNAVSTCPQGETCVAGSCSENKVDPGGLPTYTEEKVFGDGSCFDSTSCWTEPAVADLDLATCTIPGGKNINVALQTEGDGICGPVGCFVTLDADTDEGWTLGKDGKIHLPPAVCDQIQSGKIVNVVTQPIAPTCAGKTTSLPTCGPWSSASKNAPPYTGPTALAGGQPLPVAVTIGPQGLVWTNAGLPGASGAIKSIGLTGGKPKLLTAMSTAPRALATTATQVFWADAPPMSVNGGSILKVEDGTVTTIVSGLDSPEGIAVAGGKVFWGEFKTGDIFSVALDGTNQVSLATGNYPFRLVADDTYVYWTSEGMAGVMPPDGAIERVNHTVAGATKEVVATGQITPRSIALQVGQTTAVWWATLTPAGTIARATVSGATTGAPEVIATGLNLPNGLAVDDGHVYWTNRGDGTVMSLPLSAQPGDPPTILATGQNAPGAIIATADAIYWVAEGTSTNPSGAIVRLPKP